MVRIITDSAADFEPWELEKMNIICIPLVVMFGETEYQENVNLSKTRFYELLAASEDLPKTSQASPQVLVDLLEDAKKAGDEAIYITLSSAPSGTYQSALMAKALVGGDGCYIVDSLNGTGGQRMAVEQAVKLRDAGMDAAGIVAQLETLRCRIVLYACMDTLENLYRGGRISHTVYTLGSLANIKPIIRVELDGRVAVPAKAMGMRKGMDYLYKQAQKHPVDEAFPFYVMYTDNRENGKVLAEHFRKMGMDIPDAHIIQVGAAIGTHIGHNAVGFVCVEKA